MARFSVDPNKLPGLGKALAAAVTNAADREQLIQNPKEYLINHGVDENAIKDLDFAVVRDTPTTKFIVIPSEIDEGRLPDEDYQTELGNTIVLSCHL